MVSSILSNKKPEADWPGAGSRELGAIKKKPAPASGLRAPGLIMLMLTFSSLAYAVTDTYQQTFDSMSDG